MAECTLGAVLLDAGDLGGAIPHFQTAVRLVPDFSYAHEGLGRALVAAGRPEEAIPHLERSLPSLPSAPAHDALGTASWAWDVPDEAAGAFRAALRLDPENDEYLLHLGEALGNQGPLRRGAGACCAFGSARRATPIAGVSWRWRCCWAARWS